MPYTAAVKFTDDILAMIRKDERKKVSDAIDSMSSPVKENQHWDTGTLVELVFRLNKAWTVDK